MDTCGVCAGDRFIANSFGNTTRCPSCHGTGRRSEEGGLRDVTKTKPSHHLPKGVPPEKTKGPSTFEGTKLAAEVNASGGSDETKAKLLREIVDYEASHGTCTKTFIKKTRRQLRPAAG